jgi:hypothetical protein
MHTPLNVPPNAIRPPLHGTDECGRPVVRVPLASLKAHAILDRADFGDLMARGVSPNWSFDGRIVRVGNGPANTTRVSRLILSPPENHQVRHLNRNGLDLRRANLVAKPIKRHPKPAFDGQHRPL